MTKEYSSILKNNTWNLIHLPKEHKLDHCKWIYRTKYVVDGSIDKHKEHHIVNGFLQVKGIDYSETFSPFSKGVFLPGEFHEEIYMEKYYGFVYDSSHVCKFQD